MKFNQLSAVCRRQARLAGFTLVEVSVAIGVVSFAMIAMLGLLPFGLTTFQEASTLSIRSQIVQAVSSEIARTDVANIDLGPRYFDNEGNVLTTDQGDQAIYTATVTMDNFSQLTGIQVNAESGKRLTVQIQCLRSQNTPQGTYTYPLLIPNI